MGERPMELEWNRVDPDRRQTAATRPRGEAPRSAAPARRAPPSEGRTTTNRTPTGPPVPRQSGFVQREPSQELMHTIEDQVIPRLVMAHAGPAFEPADCPDARMPPTAAEVEDLADFAVAQDMPNVLAMVEAMSRDGLSMESLLLDLVSPAARLLGVQWEDDRRTFTEVTLGLGALQRVVAVLGQKSEPPISHRGLVVLCAAPGEQHTLAIQLLGELLRHAGWGAQVDPGLDLDELLDLVAAEHVVMVGMSVNSLPMVAFAENFVAQVKAASCNPDIAVMLGGAAMNAELASRLGAVFSPSAREALDWLGRHAKKMVESTRAV